MQFVVRGSARDQQTGEPLVGVVVRAYDQEPFWRQALGETTTDAAGAFQLHFHEGALRQWLDQRPSIYLALYGPSGEDEIARTPVRRSARARLHFEVEVPHDRVVALRAA